MRRQMTTVTRWRQLTIALATWAVLGAPLSVRAEQPTPVAPGSKVAAAPPTVRFEKYKLKNGLEVILSEDHRLPLVTVNVWYHVGPANERPGLTGFAHLFEHMMFEGSKHVGAKAHFRFLETAGASDVNGTTDLDRTNYYETLPSRQLELALWLESDRMGFLRGTVDREKLANQRDVVRNERRQGIENEPYGLVDEELYHQLFPKGHPYHPAVIGSHRDIEAARLDDVRAFSAQYYTPNNASLAIVGDFTPAQAKALVEKYFGTLLPGPPVPQIKVQTPPITAERRVVVGDEIELPRVYMAWITDPIYKPGDAEADLLSVVLGGSKSSRLYKKLVYTQRIAQDIQASNYSLTLGSVFTIQATAKPGVKPEQLEKSINEELAQLRAKALSQAEVDRARNLLLSGTVRSLERLGGIADRLNMYNHHLGAPGYLARDLERYQRATPADLLRVARQKLTPSARVVVYGVRGKKKIDDPPRTKDGEERDKQAPTVASKEPDEPWRASPPKPGPASKLALPKPVTFKLANGLRVLLLEHHTLPIVAANLTVLSGSGDNPLEKPGLASFTASMLDEGTSRRPSLKIAEDVDQIGASFGTGAYDDASSVGIDVLKANVDAAFDILADVTLHPTFDPKELERVRQLRLTSILQEKDEPRVLGRKVLLRVIYGASHPYGYLDIGTASSNRAMTRDDLAAFWKREYVPANTALIVAGDITAAELRALAEKHFGAWRGAPPTHRLPKVTEAARAGVYLVDKPASRQTALSLATLGVPRNNPDYVPLEVMNMALGGLFSSRINMNLREKHGYTYGAYSGFDFRRGPGLFVAGSGVKMEATGPAAQEILNEVRAIREAPISAAELATAKGAFALSLAGLFETSPQSAGALSYLVLYGLPLDYFQKLPAKIEAVNVAQVKRVAQKYLRPDAMAIIAVGDPSKIESQLKALNHGPLERRDFDANPLAAPAKP